MYNISMLYLSLSSISQIPQAMIPHLAHKYHLQIQKSLLSRYATTFLKTYTSNHKTEITNTIFQNFMASPLVFTRDEIIVNENCYIGDNREWVNDKPIKNVNLTIVDFQNIAENHRPFFISNCGDILVAGCTFHKLQSWKLDSHSGGGAIYVEQQCTVMLHECIFNDCQSNNHGGAIFICQKYKNGNIYNGGFDDDEITSLTTQFCCFQDCYIFSEIKDGPSNEKHGSAMYVAALTTNISFLSTVRCPGHNRCQHRGAQFDIQSQTMIYSSNINTTGGKSKYCSGIEYRHSQAGYFRFQTVTNMIGKFATSLTSLTTAVDVLYCNYVSNTVQYLDSNDHDYSALIHVRYKDTKIAYFYFVETIYESPEGKNDYCKLIASDSTGNPNIIHHQYAIVDNCYTDETDESRFVAQTLNNIVKCDNNCFTTY